MQIIAFILCGVALCLFFEYVWKPIFLALWRGMNGPEGQEEDERAE